MSTPFEALKREAVNLERQLEDKISRYQQVSYYLFVCIIKGQSCVFDLSTNM